MSTGAVVAWMLPPSIAGAVARRLLRRRRAGRGCCSAAWPPCSPGTGSTCSCGPCRPRARARRGSGRRSLVGFGDRRVGGAIGVILGTLRMPALLGAVGMTAAKAVGTNLVVGSCVGVVGSPRTRRGSRSSGGCWPRASPAGSPGRGSARGWRGGSRRRRLRPASASRCCSSPRSSRSRPLADSGERADHLPGSAAATSCRGSAALAPTRAACRRASVRSTRPPRSAPTGTACSGRGRSRRRSGRRRRRSRRRCATGCRRARRSTRARPGSPSRARADSERRACRAQRDRGRGRSRPDGPARPRSLPSGPRSAPSASAAPSARPSAPSDERVAAGAPDLPGIVSLSTCVPAGAVRRHV